MYFVRCRPHSIKNKVQRRQKLIWSNQQNRTLRNIEDSKIEDQVSVWAQNKRATILQSSLQYTKFKIKKLLHPTWTASAMYLWRLLLTVNQALVMKVQGHRSTSFCSSIRTNAMEHQDNILRKENNTIKKEASRASLLSHFLEIFKASRVIK